MSADEKRPGKGASSQVEDRVEGGYAAGSDGGGGERVWEQAAEATGGWEIHGTRGGEREAARRRVEARPEVMPPHPRPVDRHLEKQAAEPSFGVKAIPVAAGMFLLGVLIPQVFRRGAHWPRLRRRTAPAGPVIALQMQGPRSWRRKNRREAARLAELLRGRRFRGEVVFQ